MGYDIKGCDILNRKEHLYGALFFYIMSVGIIFLVTDIQIPFIEYIYGFFAALICGMLPDIIEPATHGNHRGAFHSIWALLISGLTILAAIYLLVNYLLFFCCIGYVSHLLLDSTTPRGLPR